MSGEAGPTEPTTTAAMATEPQSAPQPAAAAANNEDQKLNEEMPTTFPQRLLEILSNEEHADVISWLPHGRGFIIFKKKKFAAEVLPRYFKQSKFTSFTRKLNRWGFSRVTRGPETGAYYHKFFQRDDPRMCLQMSCHNTRSQSEQMALEHQAAALAGNPMSQFFPMMGMNPLLPGLASSSMSALSSTLMQQQLQQLQLGQQQIQATELAVRALKTQAVAQATQAQLAGLAAPNPVADPSVLFGNMLNQSKASSMTAKPLLTAIENSLREESSNMDTDENKTDAATNSDKEDTNKVAAENNDATIIAAKEESGDASRNKDGIDEDETSSPSGEGTDQSDPKQYRDNRNIVV